MCLTEGSVKVHSILLLFKNLYWIYIKKVKKNILKIIAPKISDTI